jgi:hypothetical protein
VVTEQRTDKDPRVEKAIKLFAFLARAQQLRSTPVRTIDGYERDGHVVWLRDVPVHDAVHCAVQGSEEPDPDAPVLQINRVPRIDPPPPSNELRVWLDGDTEGLDAPPALHAELPTGRARAVSAAELVERDGIVALEDNPAIQAAYDEWVAEWRPWADREKLDRPVRELYAGLFRDYIQTGARPEELELVVGVGCLAWRPSGHEPVRRHMLTASAGFRFDDDTGELAIVVEPSVEPLAVEIDMLDRVAITKVTGLDRRAAID